MSIHIYIPRYIMCNRKLFCRCQCTFEATETLNAHTYTHLTCIHADMHTYMPTNMTTRAHTYMQTMYIEFI